MEAMYLLVAISLVFVVAIGVAFWWAIFAGQFDNSDSEGRSILGDDDTAGSRQDEARQGSPEEGATAGGAQEKN